MEAFRQSLLLPVERFNLFDAVPTEKGIIGTRQRVCGKVAPHTTQTVFCQSIPSFK